mmetsp:Transcript_2880/g.5190  ORF Transcript_2880/g.5190 Transcript_2880/m.5190 type:complete len:237 (-) Transcript_2880:126-836(-)
MDPVVALNNQAASLLERRAYEISLRLLREALVLAQDRDARIQENGVGDSVDCEVHSEVQPSLLNDSHKYHDEYLHCPIRKPLNISLLEDNNDADFVYQNPLRIPNDKDEERELSCIILFNMALANHLWALEDVEKEDCALRSKRLKKALKLYEMSFSLQVDYGSMTITSILALVNNSASIYKHFNKVQRANKFYNHMLSSLMAMIELGEASEVEQLEGFLHNVSKLILRNVAARAA